MPTKLARPPDGWPLAAVAEALGSPLGDAVTTGLTTWLDLLVTWNARVDLTAARGTGELIDLMLADAIVLSSRVPDGAKVVDVGTGAGAPGLALSLLRPDLEVTLVEPLAKRSAFLRTVIGTLDLTRVKVDSRRGQDAARSGPRAWDVALARATLAPPAWLALGAELVNDAGAVWVFLAKEERPTHEGFALADEVPYVWPLTRAARRLVRYERRGGERPGG